MKNDKPEILELSDTRLEMIKIQFAERTIAFVATTKGLGLVAKGRPGYSPISADWFRCYSFKRSQEYANQLNEFALGIDRDEVMEIVAESMFGAQ